MRVVAIHVVVCVVFSVSDEFCFHRELLHYLLLPTPLVLLTGLASFYKASLKSSLLHQTLLNHRTSMYLAIIKTRLHQTLTVVHIIEHLCTLPLSSGAGGGAGIGEEDPRDAAPMLFVLK